MNFGEKVEWTKIRTACRYVRPMITFFECFTGPKTYPVVIELINNF